MSVCSVCMYGACMVQYGAVTYPKDISRSSYQEEHAGLHLLPGQLHQGSLLQEHLGG